MSWFDAAGFANLAKSALKEAQKTIDKALDIKDEESKVIQTHTDDSSDFFASWGLKNEERVNEHEKNPPKQQSSSSIWGSFTGSFFEAPKIAEGNIGRKTVKHSKSLQSAVSQDEQQSRMVSSVSVPEKLVEKETKSMTKKNKSVHTGNRGESSVVNESVNTDCNISKETTDKDTPESCTSPEQSSTENVPIDTETNVSKRASLDLEEVYHAPETYNTDDDDTTSSTDREEGERGDIDTVSESNDTNQTPSPTNVFQAPTVSSESDKKSLESVEILGSQSNTDCTTTPESPQSDPNSISNSISPSVVGIKVNSESVEILPDSLVTSPSSVEVLGDWKSDSSPYLSPIDPKSSELSPVPDDGDECVTPCGECINMLEPPSKDQFAEPSSSDISPYESPMEEIKTLSTNSYSGSVDSTPSPNAFPGLDTKSSSHADTSKTSPESVEVIPDVDELDEVSLAEDSYTSASEGTIMTILEPFQQLDAVKSKMELVEVNMKIPAKMHDSCPDDRQTAKACLAEGKLNLSLDSLKEKHNLHLALEPITTQPIRKVDHLEGVNEKTDVPSFSQLMSTTIEPPDPDSYSQVENVEGTKLVESTTDQYLISTDSSGEGTLIESSSDDNATLVCTDVSKVLETPLTASSYVKTMLADAMVEKGEIIDMETHGADVPRENSPISSERYVTRS